MVSYFMTVSVFASRRQVQIHLSSEIMPYSMTNVVSGLFYTRYTYNRYLRDLDKEISNRTRNDYVHA